MASPASSARPMRLHHHAFVVRDQAATREFYEDVLGLPLVATWCEEEDFGHGPTAYCHTFFELADGSSLAFFQFADPLQAKHYLAPPVSVFDHVALAVDAEVQATIRGRAAAAGLAAMEIDHGYCRSVYLRDPDGLLIELTADHAPALADAPRRRAAAHADLERWLTGDRRVNNLHRAG